MESSTASIREPGFFLQGFGSTLRWSIAVGNGSGIFDTSGGSTYLRNAVIGNQFGFYVHNGTPTLTNNIYGNSLCGYVNESDYVSANIPGNYWGSATGPTVLFTFPSDICNFGRRPVTNFTPFATTEFKIP
jgi:Periplasmic copper-binding protein (NosD)